MTEDLTPRDNGASYGGRYGIANNPYALWMINRGFGELVALTPEEMQRPEKAPRCPSPTSRKVNFQTLEYYEVDEPCKYDMRIRPEGYVCYEHAEPVRLPRPPRLQEIPFFEGGIEAAIGSEVDLAFTKEDWEARPSWKYQVRPL